MNNLLPLTLLSCLVLGLSHPFLPCHPQNDFKCADGTCIAVERECDNVPQCKGGEDEAHCEYLHRCPPGHFMCLSGECQNPDIICNGKNDCADGSDERGCSGLHAPLIRFQSAPVTPRPVSPVAVTIADPLLPLCPRHGDFQCFNGSCIPSAQHCDNIKDCSGGEDEANCGYLHNCPTDHFICRSGECEPAFVRCNGKRDCPDGSDEADCEHEHQVEPNHFVAEQPSALPNPDPQFESSHHFDIGTALMTCVIMIFIIVVIASMFLLCNHYPQARYRRDLVVDRVANVIRKSPGSPFTPKQAEKRPMVSSVVNPVFS